MNYEESVDYNKIIQDEGDDAMQQHLLAEDGNGKICDSEEGPGFSENGGGDP